MCLYQLMLSILHETRKVKFISSFGVQLAALTSQSHTIFDVVVGNEVQFFLGEVVVFGKNTIDFVYDVFGFLNFELLGFSSSSCFLITNLHFTVKS